MSPGDVYNLKEDFYKRFTVPPDLPPPKYSKIKLVQLEESVVGTIWEFVIWNSINFSWQEAHYPYTRLTPESIERDYDLQEIR